MTYAKVSKAEVTVQMGVNFTAENAESAEKLKKNRRQAPFAVCKMFNMLANTTKIRKICSSRRPQRPLR